MRINSLKLTNIGPYFGEHFFDFSTTSDKNIILIGGKNGAGKTTLLNAIKYGLFGCVALGLKNETSVYYNEINSLINNRACGEFSIEIEFEYVENYVLNKYLIKRSWIKENNSITEIVTVVENGETLNDIDTNEVCDKLKAITSPTLINSFMLDGEKISNAIENDKIDIYLQDTFNSIFNIDLVKQTKKDLDYYLRKESETTKSKDEVELVAIINRIENLKMNKKNITSSINATVQRKQSLLTLRQTYQKEFYKIGGLTKSEQISMTEKIKKILIKKEAMGKCLKTFIEYDMPLLINIDKLEKAKIQIEKERRMKYPEMVEELSEYTGIPLSKLKKKVEDLAINCTCIHELPVECVDKINSRIKDLLTEKENIKKYTGTKVNDFDEYKQMQKQLNNNNNIDKIGHIIEEIKKIDLTLIDVENQLNENEDKLKTVTEELELNIQIYERINSDIKKNELYDSSFSKANDFSKLCSDYIKILIGKKIKLVAVFALQIFNETIRKENFISNMNILDDFKLNLYDINNELIDLKILSAGEMQILVSSLIWAMFKVSGRREMFIFDTPLARLDIDNRNNYIKKIISTISQQVVVLSTDSEFVGDNYEVIKRRLAKTYLLDYDVASSTTIVKNAYFGGVL